MKRAEREAVRAEMLEVARITEANALTLERAGGLERAARILREHASRRRRLAASVLDGQADDPERIAS